MSRHHHTSRKKSTKRSKKRDESYSSTSSSSEHHKYSKRKKTKKYKRESSSSSTHSLSSVEEKKLRRKSEKRSFLEKSSYTNPSQDSPKDDELYRPLIEFVDDRHKLAVEVLKSVNIEFVYGVLPNFDKASFLKLTDFLTEMLKDLSREEIIAILNVKGRKISKDSMQNDASEIPTTSALISSNSPALSVENNLDQKEDSVESDCLYVNSGLVDRQVITINSVNKCQKTISESDDEHVSTTVTKRSELEDGEICSNASGSLKESCDLSDISSDNISEEAILSSKSQYNRKHQNSDQYRRRRSDLERTDVVTNKNGSKKRNTINDSLERRHLDISSSEDENNLVNAKNKKQYHKTVRKELSLSYKHKNEKEYKVDIEKEEEEEEEEEEFYLELVE